jgi:MIP family channel proteins
VSDQAKPDPDLSRPTPGAATLLAELVGAFALTGVGATAGVMGRVTGSDIDTLAKAVAPGLLVAAFIYALGDASGAHFNPAVTLGFGLRRVFPWRWVPWYWAAQLVGAVGAGAMLAVLFGSALEGGVTTPHVPQPTAVAVEVFLTWMLLTVILGTADRFRIVGPNAALAVGATIALCGLIAEPLTGASMNPARSLGPAIVSGHLADAWIYVLGPVIGTLLAVALTRAVHGTHRDGKQVEAATGDKVS